MQPQANNPHDDAVIEQFREKMLKGVSGLDVAQIRGVARTVAKTRENSVQFARMLAELRSGSIVRYIDYGKDSTTVSTHDTKRAGFDKMFKFGRGINNPINQHAQQQQQQQ